jgi:hypothetical protein
MLCNNKRRTWIQLSEDLRNYMIKHLNDMEMEFAKVRQENEE